MDAWSWPSRCRSAPPTATAACRRRLSPPRIAAARCRLVAARRPAHAHTPRTCTRASGECANPAPPQGRESGSNHEPASTGGPHSQGGPLEPQIQEPVTGRRKSLSVVQAAHCTHAHCTPSLIPSCLRGPRHPCDSAGHVYFLLKTPLSLGAHELHLSATSTIFAALIPPHPMCHPSHPVLATA